MITVNEMIRELKELKDKGYGDLPCIYSSDDEGNSYHLVNSEPSEFLVDDLQRRFLERAIEWDDNDEIIAFVPNCIIIN